MDSILYLLLHEAIRHMYEVTGICTCVGLLISAKSFSNSNRTRELDIVRDALKNINDLEKVFYTNRPKNTKDVQQWGFNFMNNVEWLSFLINEKRIKDKKLIKFFEKAIIGYYDEIFLKVASPQIVNDPLEYEELKKIYHKLKPKAKNLVDKNGPRYDV